MSQNTCSKEGCKADLFMQDKRKPPELRNFNPKNEALFSCPFADWDEPPKEVSIHKRRPDGEEAGLRETVLRLVVCTSPGGIKPSWS